MCSKFFSTLGYFTSSTTVKHTSTGAILSGCLTTADLQASLVLSTSALRCWIILISIMALTDQSADDALVKGGEFKCDGTSLCLQLCLQNVVIRQISGSMRQSRDCGMEPLMDTKRAFKIRSFRTGCTRIL